MAKRKQHHRKTTHRRRSRGVGSVGGSNLLMTAVGTIAGGIAGRMIGNTIGVGKDPKIIGAVQMAAGYFVAKHATNPLILGAGIGLVSHGAMDIAHTMGIIKGPGESDVYVMPPMSGTHHHGHHSLHHEHEGQSPYISATDDYMAGAMNGVIGNMPLG